MSKRLVRIVVEDKQTKQLVWYASLEVEEEHLMLAVDSTSLKVEALVPDEVLTTFSEEVVSIDEAVDLYNVYTTPGKVPSWNHEPPATRQRWMAVAQRSKRHAMLHAAPKVFDNSDVEPHGLTHVSDFES